MNRFDNLGFNEVQYDCTGSFTEIHPYRENGLRGYGQSEDWRTPGSNRTALGRFVFYSLAYHPASVIDRSVLYDGTAWKRILSPKLSERVSQARLTLQVLFFFFGQLSSFSFSQLNLRLTPKHGGSEYSVT
jgi:hypothetical protein